MKTEMDNLCKELTDRINVAMAEFIKTGAEAKQMARDGRSEEDLKVKHSKMADIFYSLRPAEPMVRFMYPKMGRLFDELIEMRENIDYSIAEAKPSVIIYKNGNEKANDKRMLDSLLGK